MKFNLASIWNIDNIWTYLELQCIPTSGLYHLLSGRLRSISLGMFAPGLQLTSLLWSTRVCPCGTWYDEEEKSMIFLKVWFHWGCLLVCYALMDPKPWFCFVAVCLIILAPFPVPYPWHFCLWHTDFGHCCVTMASWDCIGASTVFELFPGC